MVLNPGAQGDGLRHAFNQTQGRDKPEAQDAPQATGLNPEDENPENEDKSFVSRFPDGNLYNTEVDIPVRDNPAMTNNGSNRRIREEKHMDKVQLGNHLQYRDGSGTVVAKENMMIKLADDTTHTIITMPIGETFFKDDMLATSNVGAQLWDMMQADQRNSVLNKAKITGDVVKAYLNRDWHNIPDGVKDIIKESNYYDGVSHGGVEGREPSFNDRNEESRSHRDLTQPSHVTKPYSDKQAPAFAKSDVEHGAYGGVVTDTPFDADDDYEEDKRTGDRRQTQHEKEKEPKDPKKYPTDPKWDETHKGEQQQAAITGKPDLKEKEEEKDKQMGSYPSSAASMPTTKDEDSGVGPNASGFQGAKPNAQSAEKDLSLTSITGEPSKKEDGGAKTGHPIFGNGPDRQKNIINQNNSRWGPRQASAKDLADWIANN